MNLSEQLGQSRILVNFKADKKEDVLSSLIALVVNGFDKDELSAALLERENLGSTGIGYGVAVPHMRMDSITEPVVAFGLSEKPVDFDAIDDAPCRLFFLVIGPSDPSAQDAYLKTMARISRLMRNASTRERLLESTTPSEVMTLIQEFDA